MPSPAHQRRSSPRAQTLVLFALTLLLLCVLVLMTIGIGTKLIEKTDLNHMADTTAYNQAVVVARTFNSISLINRTQVSHMVALAGVQSLISWTGAYRGSVAMLRGQFQKQKEGPKDKCDDDVGEGASLKTRQDSKKCGCVAEVDMTTTIEIPLLIEEARIGAAWDALDEAAGAQARAIRAEAEVMYAEQVYLYQKELMKQVGGQALANDMLNTAKEGQPNPEELEVPASSGDVAMRELATIVACASGDSPDGFTAAGGLEGLSAGPKPPPGPCKTKGPNAHAVWAAMGTRGWAFTTSRGDQVSPFLQRLAAILPPRVSVSMQLVGSGYFADNMAHGMATMTNQMAWADDHISVGATYELAKGTACSTKGGFNSKGDAWVKSSAGGDEHVWPTVKPNQPGEPATLELLGDTPASPRHTVGIMWPRFIDYNASLLGKPEDSYGQPKNYAMVTRDYSVRRRLQPWEKHFKLDFSGEGGTEIDLRGNRAAAPGDTVQAALSSGVSYYHRPGHWKEPPNFFNPMWRATLMAADLLDSSSVDDVPRTLAKGGAPDAAKAYNALYRAGYRGY